MLTERERKLNRERMRRYYWRHPDKAKAYIYKWYHDNYEEISKRRAEKYKAANKCRECMYFWGPPTKTKYKYSTQLKYHCCKGDRGYVWKRTTSAAACRNFEGAMNYGDQD